MRALPWVLSGFEENVVEWFVSPLAGHGMATIAALFEGDTGNQLTARAVLFSRITFSIVASIEPNNETCIFTDPGALASMILPDGVRVVLGTMGGAALLPSVLCDSARLALGVPIDPDGDGLPVPMFDLINGSFENRPGFVWGGGNYLDLADFKPAGFWV
jgi:hypothetical protein